MRFARIALCLCAAFALTVKLTGRPASPRRPSLFRHRRNTTSLVESPLKH